MSNRIVVSLATLLIGVASAGVAQAQSKCDAGKLKEYGKKVFCLEKVDSKAAKKGEPVDAAKEQKCIEKFADKCAKAEAKGDCTGAVKECADLMTEADTCRDAADPATPPCGAFPATGQTTAYGTGSDGDLEFGAPLSYTDNGDGTITDNNTGLMWEKKSDDGSIHDVDNTYTWCGASCGGTNIMDGTIVGTFLTTLNGGGGFAGYTDWRIPNAKELQSIVNYENVLPSVSPAFETGCVAACTVTTCSCTASSSYWSSATFADDPLGAWFVNFSLGFVSATGKAVFSHVRAVRGGS